MLSLSIDKKPRKGGTKNATYQQNSSTNARNRRHQSVTDLGLVLMEELFSLFNPLSVWIVKTLRSGLCSFRGLVKLILQVPFSGESGNYCVSSNSFQCWRRDIVNLRLHSPFLRLTEGINSIYVLLLSRKFFERCTSRLVVFSCVSVFHAFHIILD